MPLDGIACGNERIWVPHTRGTVISSGRIAVARPVSPTTESRLCRLYGIVPSRGAKLESGERRSALFAVGLASDVAARAAMVATDPPRDYERRVGLSLQTQFDRLP